jgi:hypothetical protein
VWAVLNATKGRTTLTFLDNGEGGWTSISHAVSITFATGGNKWPGAAGVDSDGNVPETPAPLELGGAIYHFRFENTDTEKRTLQFTIDLDESVQPTAAPTSDGYALGGDDALAIILSMAVVALIFAVVSVASTRLEPETGALLLR